MTDSAKQKTRGAYASRNSAQCLPPMLPDAVFSLIGGHTLLQEHPCGPFDDFRSLCPPLEHTHTRRTGPSWNSELLYLYDSGFPEIGPFIRRCGKGTPCWWDMTLSWLRGGRLMATLLPRLQVCIISRLCSRAPAVGPISWRVHADNGSSIRGHSRLANPTQTISTACWMWRTLVLGIYPSLDVQHELKRMTRHILDRRKWMLNHWVRMCPHPLISWECTRVYAGYNVSFKLVVASDHGYSRSRHHHATSIQAKVE